VSKGVKFGIDLSLEAYEAENWERYINFVKIVDENVWDSLWLGDHLGGLPPISPFKNYNVWPIFSLFAELKRKPLLGTAVTDPHRYHPAVLAQISMTIDHISNGRFILGLGAGEAFNLETYGFSYKNKPVSKMVEFIEVLRKLWNSRGQKVSHKGEFFELKDAVFEPPPIKNPIPIWMAANGPKTRWLAGALADGWIPIPLSADTYKAEAGEVKDSLKKNNRDMENFTFGYWNWIFIHENETELQLYLELKKLSIPIQFAKEMKLLGYWKEEKRELYKKLGFSPEKLSLLSFHSIDQLDLGVLGEIVKDVPNDFVREATLMGTKEEVTKKLEKLIKGGVQHFVLMIDNDIAKDPKNPDPYTYEHVYQILTREIIPYLKEQY